MRTIIKICLSILIISYISNRILIERNLIYSIDLENSSIIFVFIAIITNLWEFFRIKNKFFHNKNKTNLLQQYLAKLITYFFLVPLKTLRDLLLKKQLIQKLLQKSINVFLITFFEKWSTLGLLSYILIYPRIWVLAGLWVDIFCFGQLAFFYKHLWVLSLILVFEGLLNLQKTYSKNMLDFLSENHLRIIPLENNQYKLLNKNNNTSSDYQNYVNICKKNMEMLTIHCIFEYIKEHNILLYARCFLALLFLIC